MRPMRERISANEAQPFPWSNDSHASQSGSRENCAKYAKPQIALCGARSLKRNGENCGARKVRCDEGVQKFSSVSRGRSARKRYQPSSVMAIVPTILCARSSGPSNDQGMSGRLVRKRWEQDPTAPTQTYATNVA